MSADRVRFHEGARADVKNAVVWYQRHSAKAAADFVEEIYRATETIKAAPERWPEEKYGARRFLLWRFPFSIIYSEHDSIVTVWAVVHASRRPEYWARRM
jgi:plasmid stabilization system protein ParE